MNEFDKVAYSKLVEKLRAETGKSEISSGDKIGMLYKAITVVAKHLNKNPNPFMQSNEIFLNNNLLLDQKVLQKFGLPGDYLAKFIWQKTRPEIYELLIVSAVFVVTFLKEPSSDTQEMIAPLLQPSDEKKFFLQDSSSKPVSKFAEIFLGLILKGTDLGDIQTGSEITLEQLLALSEKANYFICIYQADVEEKRGQMSIQSGPVDRTSEQQVFIGIHFLHTSSSLKDAKQRENKLLLIQYLRDCNGPFHIETIETLAKVSGLGKLGFVRSYPY